MGTRKFSRVQFNVNATVRTANRQFSGRVENLSMNGMFVVTPQRLPVDEAVDIVIVLAGSDPEISVDFIGRVSRITEDGIGFIFEKIDLDSYMHLKNIISYNIEDSETVQDEIHHSIDEKLHGGK